MPEYVCMMGILSGDGAVCKLISELRRVFLNMQSLSGVVDWTGLWTQSTVQSASGKNAKVLLFKPGALYSINITML